MTSFLLALVLISNPAEIEAQFEWSLLASEYALPPAVIVESEIGTLGATGLMGGFDQQGRARIVIAPGQNAEGRRKVIAHEAYHAALRAAGVPYGELAEERAANTFAYCWVRDATYLPERPCPEALASLPSRYSNR